MRLHISPVPCSCRLSPHTAARLLRCGRMVWEQKNANAEMELFQGARRPDAKADSTLVVVAHSVALMDVERFL